MFFFVSVVVHLLFFSCSIGSDGTVLTIGVSVSDNVWGGCQSATIHGIIFGKLGDGQFDTVPFRVKGVLPVGEVVEFKEIPTKNLIEVIRN